MTSEYGCVALSAPYTYILADVAEAAGRTLRVAPNPMGGGVHLSEPLAGQHHIELVDVSGRVLRVLRPTGRSVTLFREGLGAGPISCGSCATEGGGDRGGAGRGALDSSRAPTARTVPEEIAKATMRCRLHREPDIEPEWGPLDRFGPWWPMA